MNCFFKKNEGVVCEMDYGNAFCSASTAHRKGCVMQAAFNAVMALIVYQASQCVKPDFTVMF